MERKPVFIKITEYNDLLDVLALARSKLQQAKTLHSRLSELNKEEEEQVARWEEQLSLAEKNLEELDETLARPQ